MRVVGHHGNHFPMKWIWGRKPSYASKFPLLTMPPSPTIKLHVLRRTAASLSLNLQKTETINPILTTSIINQSETP